MEPQERPPKSPQGQLAAAARSGNLDSYGELYGAEVAGVYDFLLRTVRDAEVAQELTEATFKRGFTQLDGLRDPDRVRPWLFGVALGVALEHLRAGTADRPHLSGAASTKSGVAAHLSATDRAGVADLVWAAAESLDPEQYALLDLTVRQGLDLGEVVAELPTTDDLKTSRAQAAAALRAAHDTFGRAVRNLMISRNYDSCPGVAPLAQTMIPPLTNKESRRVDDHLARCPRCRPLAEGATAPGALAALAALPPPEALARDGWQRLAWDLVRAAPRATTPPRILLAPAGDAGGDAGGTSPGSGGSTVPPAVGASPAGGSGASPAGGSGAATAAVAAAAAGAGLAAAGLAGAGGGRDGAGGAAPGGSGAGAPTRAAPAPSAVQGAAGRRPIPPAVTLQSPGNRSIMRHASVRQLHARAARERMWAVLSWVAVLLLLIALGVVLLLRRHHTAPLASSTTSLPARVTTTAAPPSTTSRVVTTTTVKHRPKPKPKPTTTTTTIPVSTPTAPPPIPVVSALSPGSGFPGAPVVVRGAEIVPGDDVGFTGPTIPGGTELLTPTSLAATSISSAIPGFGVFSGQEVKVFLENSAGQPSGSILIFKVLRFYSGVWTTSGHRVMLQPTTRPHGSTTDGQLNLFETDVEIQQCLVNQSLRVYAPLPGGAPIAVSKSSRTCPGGEWQLLGS